MLPAASDRRDIQYKNVAFHIACGWSGAEGLTASFKMKFTLWRLDLHFMIYLVFLTRITSTNSVTISSYRPPVSCLNHLYTASYTVSSRLTRRFSLPITSIRCSADIARKSGSLTKLLKFQSTKRSILALKCLCFSLWARLWNRRQLDAWRFERTNSWSSSTIACICKKLTYHDIECLNSIQEY